MMFQKWWKPMVTANSVATTPTREGSETGGEDSSAGTAESPPEAATKPTHTILEITHLEQTFKGFTCPECEASLH
jgi:hypothetical protein